MSNIETMQKKDFYVALSAFDAWHDQDTPYNQCGYGFDELDAIKMLASNIGSDRHFHPYSWTKVTIRKYTAIEHDGNIYLPIKTPRTSMYNDDDFSHLYEEYDVNYTDEYALNTRPEYLESKAILDKQLAKEKAEKREEERQEKLRKIKKLQDELNEYA